MTKPRPPRPVRAWATCVTRSMDMSSHPRGEKIPVLWGRKDRVTYGRPIRVTVVPDGATSAEAECRRLRREIRLIRGRVQELRIAHLTGKVVRFAIAFELIDAALRRKGGSR